MTLLVGGSLIKQLSMTLLGKKPRSFFPTKNMHLFIKQFLN